MFNNFDFESYEETMIEDIFLAEEEYKREEAECFERFGVSLEEYEDAMKGFEEWLEER